MKQTSNRWGKWVLAAGLGLSSMVASAEWLHFDKPEDAVAYRQGAFQVMEHHFSRLTNMALRKVPYDASAATEDANAVMLLSRLPFLAFPEGSGALAGHTRASALVWQAAPRFADSARRLQEKADQMPAAVAAGNIERLRQLVVDAGATCRKCHDQFRER